MWKGKKRQMRGEKEEACEKWKRRRREEKKKEKKE